LLQIAIDMIKLVRLGWSDQVAKRQTDGPLLTATETHLIAVASPRSDRQP
jgi:hypothetical protein